MATKTISIDTEAYRRLKSVKRRNESFSQAIKRVVPQPIDFEKWRAMIENDTLNKNAVEAVEAAISERRTIRPRYGVAGVPKRTG